MSQGERMPVELAQRVAAHLIRAWGLGDRAVVVGSVRRCRPEVGDVEILLPIGAMPERPTARDDAVFRAINATLDQPVPVEPEAPAGLFAAPPAPLPPPPWTGQPFAKVISGVKPGFLSASLAVRMRAGPTAVKVGTVGVQLHRARPESWGWKMVYLTGPREFGIMFLAAWKNRYGIGRDQQASRDGHLIDAGGRVVPALTEEDAFKACGLEYVEPHRRDAAVQTNRLLRSSVHEETHR